MRLEPNRGSLVEVPADDSNFSYNYGYRSLYWKDWLAVSTGKDQQWLPLVGLPGNFVERSLKVSKRKPAMPLYQAVARSSPLHILSSHRRLEPIARLTSGESVEVYLLLPDYAFVFSPSSGRAGWVARQALTQIARAGQSSALKIITFEQGYASIGTRTLNSFPDEILAFDADYPSRSFFVFSKSGEEIVFDVSNPASRAEFIALVKRVLGVVRTQLIQCNEGELSASYDCRDDIYWMVETPLITLLELMLQQSSTFEYLDDILDVCDFKNELEQMLLEIDAPLDNPYPYDHGLLNGTYGKSISEDVAARIFHHVLRPYNYIYQDALSACERRGHL